MRAYQLLKGGAGIDALVKVEGPSPSRPTAKCWSRPRRPRSTFEIRDRVENGAVAM
jgi:hypothetical protein